MNPNPRKRSTDRRQAEDRKDTRTSALATSRVITGAPFKLGHHDRRPTIRPTPPTASTTSRSGRAQDRARAIYPEEISDLTGLVPGATVYIADCGPGYLTLRLAPHQDAARLTWQADRLLRITQAQHNQAHAIAFPIARRRPYTEVGPSGRKKRRQIEARRGIPRDYPRQATDRTDPT